MGVLGVAVLSGLGATLAVLLLRSPATPPRTAGEGVPAVATATSTAAVIPDDADVRDALAVLHDWDVGRAAAYARGDVRRLRDLYVPRSSAGAADVRVLTGYRSRGLRVAGLRTQVLALAVLERRPERWVLRVTDRVQAGVAVHAGRRLPLPRDAASTRVLTLVRSNDARWRVERVQDVRPLS